MSPTDIEPWAERIASLYPAVLEAAWRPSTEGAERARALAVAAGRLLRYAEAVEACDEDGQPARRALGPALLALRRARSLLPSPSAQGDRLIALARDAHLRALQAPVSPRREGLERLRDAGDPGVAADRLALLGDADDALSVARVLEHLGSPVDAEVIRSTSLRIGRHLLQGLSEATRWRVEAVVERECVQREGWTDPIGRTLWLSLVEPDQRAELLREATGALGARATLAAASPEEPERRRPPGEIQLLLWDPRSGLGYAVPLSVELDPMGRVWGRDERWAATAWTAVRAGYLAAAACLPLGVAPAPLESHRVRISGELQVDGESLGLAAALAFFSAWTGQGLPEGAAATGVVSPLDGGVRRVESLGAKIEGWRRSFGGTSGPVVVPVQDDAPPDAVRCPSVAAALAACGLRPGAATPLDIETRADRVRTLARWVDRQELGAVPVLAGGSPWALLGDMLHVAVSALADESDPGVDLREARVRAALAWLHAGELALAEAALAALGEGPLPPALELLEATVRLTLAIDAGGGELEDARIAALLERREPAMEPGRFMALSTRGRWRLHRHDPDGLALLEAGIAAAPGWERGRTRIYLAMALRQAGRADAALAELERAEEDLDQHTRPRSLTYYASTRVYLRYEQGRAALALGAPEQAIARAEEALTLAPAGFWPRAGILRTLARALRASGRTAEADAAATEVEALAAAAPSGVRPIVEAMAAEARGEAVEPPVVY